MILIDDLEDAKNDMQQIVKIFIETDQSIKYAFLVKYEA